METRLFGLPETLPWPGELPDPAAGEPLNLEELMRAIPRAVADPSADLPASLTDLEPFLHKSAECKTALMEGDQREASRLLKELDSLRPCPAVWLMRAESLIARKDMKGAARALEKCAEVVPDLDAVWLMLGSTHEAAGNKSKAVKTYLQGRESCPGSEPLAEALVRLGVLFRFKFRDDVEDPYVDVNDYRRMVAMQLERFPTSVEDLEKVSLDVARHGFDTESEELIHRKILSLDPDHRPTLLRLAGLYVRTDRLEEGERLLSRVAADGAEEGVSLDAPLLFQLHSLASKRGDTQASARWLDAALEADPNHAPSLAAAFANNPALPPAEREARLREFSRRKNSIAAANMAAQFAMQRRDQRRAVEDCEFAWKIDPGNKTMFLNYTQGLYSIGENEKLAALLRPEYEAGRLDWMAKWPYAVALRELGHPQDAVRILDEMLRDRKLPRVEVPRLQEQRDVWTGYIAGPGGDRRLRYRDHPDHILEAVVMTGFAGEEIPPLPVIPANSPTRTRNEFPFDSLPPGTKTLRLDLAQEEAEAFAGKTPLGSFVVKGIEPRKLRSERLFVTFRYDRDGLMYVSARQGRKKLKVEWQEPEWPGST